MGRSQATLRPSKQTPRRQLNWLVLLLVLIAVILLVRAYLDNRSSHLQQNNSPALPISTQPSMQFDFYTVLPKMLVTTPLVTKVGIPAEQYMLQIAALRQDSEAQRLSNQMQALGFHAVVQEYHSTQSVWFRVILGPYSSLDMAERDQQRLKQHRIEAVLLKQQR